jgi:hypothetical protein
MDILRRLCAACSVPWARTLSLVTVITDGSGYFLTSKNRIEIVQFEIEIRIRANVVFKVGVKFNAVIIYLF